MPQKPYVNYIKQRTDNACNQNEACGRVSVDLTIDCRCQRSQPFCYCYGRGLRLCVISQADDDTLEAEFRIQIKTYALAGIIEWWLSEDISLTVEAMVRNILKVLVKLETLDIKAE